MNFLKYKENFWNKIDWKTVEKKVFKLQKRIYKASASGNVRLVHSLQRLLTKSYYGKLLATRKVTQDNQGKKTAGVDGLKSLNPKQRTELVKDLKLRGNCKPTRRVNIPKPNGETRPLGIPCMEDRAKQALVKLALEPQWEAKFEPNSYGFRPGRSCHDAIQAIFDSITKQPKYVLDADIAKCFDKIDHKKLLAKLETYPKCRREINSWLKSGYMSGDNLFPTEEGTPQGGVISPLLANIALHGMEIELKRTASKWKSKGRSSKQIQDELSIIRYADDFVILHKDIERVLECKEVIEKWLENLGLKLKPNKTCISHTLHEYDGNIGFDFLGFNIRQYEVGKTHSGKKPNGKLLGFKTIIKPSKEKIKLHTKKVGEIIDKHKASSQEVLIKVLNPVITGWGNYYRTVCSKKSYKKCDDVKYFQLKRWAERRHPKKSKSWIKKRYWHSVIEKGENGISIRNWVFKTDEGFELKEHGKTEIVRHTKVRGESSPYNGDWIYWSSRRGENPDVTKRMATLLRMQKGKCRHCGLSFKDTDLLEIDHMIPKSQGGKDVYKNLQVLHRHCHDEKTNEDYKKYPEMGKRKNR